MVHVAALKTLLVGMAIHPSRKTQISALIQDKAPTKVPPKYADYANVFSFNLAIELPENTGMNQHSIELQDGKQPLYRLIYSLGPVELETLKTYIKIHFKTKFIQLFKFLIGIRILFNKKPKNSLWLCVNYWDFNNLIIKNRYLLPLIEEALDRLGKAKWFT